MTFCRSSTFLLARPRVPSCEGFVSSNSRKVLDTGSRGLLPCVYASNPGLGKRGAVRTYSSLRQLSGSLVLAVSQQLDHSSLVGCEAGDFLDDVADEGGSLGEVAFASGDFGSWGEGGYFLGGC